MQPLRLARNCTIIRSFETNFECVAERSLEYGGVACRSTVSAYHYLVQLDDGHGPPAEVCGENDETCTCCDASGCLDQRVNGLISFSCSPVLRNYSADICWRDPHNNRVYWHQLKPEPIPATLLLSIGICLILPTVFVLALVLFPYCRSLCSRRSCCLRRSRRTYLRGENWTEL